jgi:CheY-like chemotaxis protein
MSETVLIVDDAMETRMMLRLLLELYGFDVSEAKDGQDAVEKVAQSLPNVVIMDVMMPNMDGITACKILRQKPDSSHLPIIMLSGKVSKEAVNEGMAAGANMYLPKPVNTNELVESIRALCAISAPMPQMAMASA